MPLRWIRGSVEKNIDPNIVKMLFVGKDEIYRLKKTGELESAKVTRNDPCTDAYIFYTSSLILSRYVTSWDIILISTFQPNEILHDVMHCIDFFVSELMRRENMRRFEASKKHIQQNYKLELEHRWASLVKCVITLTFLRVVNFRNNIEACTAQRTWDWLKHLSYSVQWLEKSFFEID